MRTPVGSTNRTSFRRRVRTLPRTALHLQRRFVRALSDAPPPDEDLDWALSFLGDGERTLWRTMQHQDQRHTIEVARRLVALLPEAPRVAVAAALLHDVGKVEGRLGTFERVAATLIGPRTQRFRRYHDHERIGAEMMRAAGSDERSVALVEETSTERTLANALHRADSI